MSDTDSVTGVITEWTCGHVAGAMCQECYRILAGQAHELEEEILALRASIEDMRSIIEAAESRLVALREELEAREALARRNPSGQ